MTEREILPGWKMRVFVRLHFPAPLHHRVPESRIDQSYISVPFPDITNENNVILSQKIGARKLNLLIFRHISMAAEMC